VIAVIFEVWPARRDDYLDIAEKERFILAEERTFLRRVE